MPKTNIQDTNLNSKCPCKETINNPLSKKNDYILTHCFSISVNISCLRWRRFWYDSKVGPLVTDVNGSAKFKCQ